MKILMLGRIGLMEVGGGDKVQITNTANELEKLGVEVDIKTSLNVDMAPYDLVHVFQLDWTPETYFYAKKAKEIGKPLVLSPIHHSIKEVKKFEENYAFDLRRISKILFREQHSRDTFKNIYRSFSNPEKIIPTMKSIFIGLKKMHQKTLSLSDVVLVQTDLEAWDLKQTYGVDFKWVKIPNGVGEQFLRVSSFENPFKDTKIKDYILCVGRIEPRKNQLSVIEAVNLARKEVGEDLQLVFIGKKNSSHHIEYGIRFNHQLRKYPWITHIEQVPYEQMPSYYRFAKIGVSASWFETTGLTSLEALFCGANAVAAGSRAKEYLGKNAFYCSPDDVDSIKGAILKAYNASPPVIPEDMKVNYTWANAAKKTLEVYKNGLK